MKKKILILGGGISKERLISLETAKSVFKELKKKDLNHKSDFNTYLNRGLPKGPICNPGRESILAVTNPSKGDLLYFVSNGKGGHNFSSDYKTHLENIDKLKKINNQKYEN